MNIDNISYTQTNPSVSRDIYYLPKKNSFLSVNFIYPFQETSTFLQNKNKVQY